MSARTSPMSAADVQARRQHAHAFLSTAELVVEFGGDAGIESTSNLLGSLAVLAGIASSDAICGHVRRERANGEAHADAVALLRSCSAPDERFAAQLKRLLDAKTTTQYSSAVLGDVRAGELMTAARRLVDGMELKLRS
jgi:hypothetical protein